ncbi:MAG: hypothetical protein OEL20_04850 [Sulfuritalea sp.]|nr:hypothetical protein [Sulfuritalea sp.]
MNRSELNRVFRDESALLQKIAVASTSGKGAIFGGDPSNGSPSAFDVFLAAIDLDRDGIVSARDRIVAFLGLDVDQDDPVFGLPATMVINDNGDTVAINERLVVAIQPRSETVTETTHVVTPGRYNAGYVDVRQKTTYWDDVWFRLLFGNNPTEQRFRWDCSRCRPGHRLIALFRNERRAAMVNVDAKTYWVERAGPGLGTGLAVMLGVPLSIFVAWAFLLPSVARSEISGFVMASVLATAALFGGWIVRSRGVEIENDLRSACCRLLGVKAPARQTARMWGFASLALAGWSAYLLVSSSSPAPLEKGTPSATAPRPAKASAATKQAKDELTVAAGRTAQVTPPDWGPVAKENEDTRSAFLGAKRACAAQKEKGMMLDCLNKIVARLTDPANQEPWIQRLSASQREDNIKGVRILLAEVQAGRD